MLQASGASVERAVAASTSVFGTSKSETMRQASGGSAESAAAASDYSPPCFLAWDDVRWRRPPVILRGGMSRRRLSDQLGLQETDGLQQAKQDQLLSQDLLPKHMGPAI